MTAAAAIDSPAPDRSRESELLVDLVRLSRITLLYGDAGSAKTELLRSSVMPLLRAEGARQEAEVAIFFDDWGEAPLPALHARIYEAVAAQAHVPWPSQSARSQTAGAQSLLATLSALQQALGVAFLFIFDRFEEHLAAPLDGAGVREFAEALVQIVNEPSLRANFLLSLDEDAAPLLSRFSDRIPDLGDACVRLPRPSSAVTTQPAVSITSLAAAPVTPELVATPELFATKMHEPREEAEAEVIATASSTPQEEAQPLPARRKPAWLAWFAWAPIAAASVVLFFLWSNKVQHPSPSPRDGEMAQATHPAPSDVELAPQRVAAAPAATPDEPGSPPAAERKRADRSERVAPSQKTSPAPAARVAAAEAPSGPTLYIHVRDQAQRAQAEKMIRPLAKRGIRVTGIKVVSFGPSERDLRYFRAGEREEAERVARALQSVGAPTKRLKRIAGYEAQATPRQYELWLPPSRQDSRG